MIELPPPQKLRDLAAEEMQEPSHKIHQVRTRCVVCMCVHVCVVLAG